MPSPDFAITSALTITSLTVQTQGQFDLITFVVSDPYNDKGPTYLRLDVVEIWFNHSGGRDVGLTFKGEGLSPLSVPANQTNDNFYWGRCRNRAGGYGDWFPVAGGAADNSQRVTTTGIIGVSGYRFFWQFPNGLLIQGGSDTVAAGGSVITFPTSFATLVSLLATSIHEPPSPDQITVVNIAHFSAIGFNLLTTNLLGVSVAATVNWLAIGFYP